MKDDPIMTIDKARIKTYVFEFIYAMEKINKIVSLCILVFTFTLAFILFRYSGPFNPADIPLDIIFIKLMYITVASNVCIYTYFMHKIGYKNNVFYLLCSVVVVAINNIIAHAIIPHFDNTYQTHELILVMTDILNPIILWYMVYLTIFGLIKIVISVRPNEML